MGNSAMTVAAPPPPTVAVIGGGYAGMAAAVTLAESGIACTVFEAGKTLGGRARRIDYRGEILDNGQHILAGAYSELLRLMRLVGVASSALRRVPLRLFIPPNFLLNVPGTSLLPGTLCLAWAMLTAKGLGFGDKLAAIRFMRWLKHNNYQVAASKTVATMLAELRQPQNLIDHFWQPLTISALNTPLATASAQVFANVLRDTLASNRTASDLLLPCVDLTALFPDPAAAWLTSHRSEVLLGTRVREILSESGRYRVHSDAGGLLFNGVIVSTGPHQLDNLLTNVMAPEFTYEPIVTIYFKFESRVRLPEPMIGQISGFAQWFFDRRVLSGSSNENDGLIAAVISASGPHDLLSQDALAEAVLTELAQHIPGLPPPTWRKVVTERFATFACTTGADRPGAATLHPRVYLAGDYVAGDYPATLEGAVRNGVAAANGLIAEFRASKSNSNQ